ncbi:hypothetical protein [Pedobacter kyonggii]|uniref:Uncharacterized protein n=1 Tax=Pedobacter kyonggii TaxID=1926871 RepID=A0A4V2JGP1_9SPHI|nr:hypothetical protein [Pedobacter kyonggii]TBO41330.1 hypothetical protein EYS08_15170 [Pedobacter kyonggii]
MKIKLIPTASILLIFGLFTALSYKDNAASDGFTKVGFPFNFYNYAEGKFSDPAYTSNFGFSTKYFVTDLLILIAFILLLILLLKN